MGLSVRKCRFGRGVFAMAELKSGTLIAPITGRVLSAGEVTVDHFDLGRGRVLAPDAPCKFLNHSCAPNAEVILEAGRGRATGKLSLWALVDIAPRQEVTIDYGCSAADAVRCRCGQPTCRGWTMAAGARG